jgi:mannose-6-phosphate isomerase
VTFSGPLRFRPWLRPMPWGGRRLAPWLGLPAPAEPVGEAWLLSDHPLHTSIVSDGPHAGQSLSQLIARSPHPGTALLGRPTARFPLLIKILEARENLSIQVHPDDDAAKRWAPAEGGKTEAWAVLDSEPDGLIYLGLKPGVDQAALQRELATGNAPLCLQRHQPRPGETYLVPAGTVHALGQGVMVLEVQQTSDATFRLYDWGRIGADGRPRPVHLQAGMACILEHPQAGPQIPRSLADGSTLLVESPFFSMRRLGVGSVTVPAPAVLVLWQGSASLGDGSALRPGEAVLIPAGVGSAQLEVQPGAAVFSIHWP